MNCPGDLPVGQQTVGWVERFAKPIAIVPIMMGIAEFIIGRAFARPVGSTHPTRCHRNSGIQIRACARCPISAARAAGEQGEVSVARMLRSAISAFTRVFDALWAVRC